jgi:hypothetical protein
MTARTLQFFARRKERGFKVTFKGSGKLQVVCAWCGRVESRPQAPEGVAAPAAPISHTICDACFVKERAEVERIVKGRRKRSSA